MTWGRCILTDKGDGDQDCVQEVGTRGSEVERRQDEGILRRSRGFSDHLRTRPSMTSRSPDVF